MISTCLDIDSISIPLSSSDIPYKFQITANVFCNVVFSFKKTHLAYESATFICNDLFLVYKTMSPK